MNQVKEAPSYEGAAVCLLYLILFFLTDRSEGKCDGC